MDWRMDLMQGDCLEMMAELEDASVDSIVTDPPYGLSFMGKRWDYDVPSVEIWAECLRVLKPGGHLLAFAGTRTQHRMAVRIEDAGFEIRDMIAWVYGSGFPKSKNLDGDWQGWGTALKPALETVTLASKPFPFEAECAMVLRDIAILEARLCLLSSLVSAAELTSASSLSASHAALFDTAQWSVADAINTRDVLCGQMDMSLFEWATDSALSIASSWKRIWAEILSDGSTFTIETVSKATTDLRTLRFCLSQITPDTIVLACSLPNGFHANASIAESHFNASLLFWQSTRALSVTAPAIAQEVETCRDAGVRPNLNPCVVARKPLGGTVAANVLEWGTGAINVDGCRVAIDPEADASQLRTMSRGQRDADTSGQTWGLSKNGGDEPQVVRPEGRWPANLIHDGSDEVTGLFPGEGTGSAARFFYCAKASKRDRDEGLGHLPERAREARYGSIQDARPHRADGYVYHRGPQRNHHPTVKPTDLMRYLCRLVTPPGGIVLDPFMGSGSTGKGAVLEGFRFIGIEREADYMDIAEARITAAIKVADGNS